VLEVLCRPCAAAGGPHPPASNEEIAAELHLSVDAVKAHLRQLFRRFEIEALPQIQKRTALVRLALASGILRSPP
jgi:DNA-binding NarL/FixJ family response regulator